MSKVEIENKERLQALCFRIYIMRKLYFLQFVSMEAELFGVFL